MTELTKLTVAEARNGPARKDFSATELALPQPADARIVKGDARALDEG